MNITRYITIVIALFFFVSCEDVVNVDLNTAPPRLVVDASINWQKGTDGSIQKIILSSTTDYYSNVIPKVSGATVSIKNSQNTTFVFTEIPNTGEYESIDFDPIIGETYTLTIIYNGATYTASETMQSVTPIESVAQKNNAGFSGEDYEVVVYYQDPLAKNFYMAKFFPDIYKSPTFMAIGDEFSNGNQKSWNFSDEDLKQGTAIAITHYGISENYYNYMNKIIATVGSSGPFATTPAAVRGNIVNQTNIENYALGYFSLNEVDSENYIIK
ncbi:DUF4249 domain-containing protein [Flavobacterium granuli]|uniref:DUF4249 domain-containing protein n=1 Tax=Flavobacterium granuli TaxID=280093 RepID=A0ABU1RXZ8_9FLAO|nr:DUF4249 domain-containing protein [Flavobacterium granuli]MDR6843640.1 hypothetical protein [Flavobacterium granuli]